MTHQDECPAIDDLTALLIEHGPAAMASAITTLMNHAMQIEREHVPKAESHQRTRDRQDYANGFKPKTLKTRASLVAACNSPRLSRTGDPSSKASWIAVCGA